MIAKKRIAFSIQLFAEGSADVQVPSEIHVVPTGNRNHPVYGEMEITSDDIKEFVQNFNNHVRGDIPITAGHDNGMSGGELPAIGWFTDVIDCGFRHFLLRDVEPGFLLSKRGKATLYEDPMPCGPDPQPASR